MNVRKDAFAYSVWLVGCAVLVVFAVLPAAADVKVPAGWTSEARTVKVAGPDGDTDKEITYYKGRLKVAGKKNLQLEYVYIPAGRFTMGDPETRQEQRPVEIAKGFFLSRCEVTQAQYKKVMGKNPSHFKNKPNNPVEKVSWADALEFCKRLSKMEGATCRLATDEEWEYACRAGSTGKFYWGENMRGDCAWWGRNRGGRPQEVGQKLPNAWGLYDMAGNSVEWVTGEADPEIEGSAKDGYYLRGGPVDEYDWSLKSHVRQWYADIFTGYNNLTIRVVVEVGGGEARIEGGSAKAGPPGGWTSRTAKVKAATPKGDMPVEVTYYQNSVTPAVLGSEVGMEFVLIQPGQFVMSSPARERGRHPDEPEQHDVTIDKPFYIGAYEVTQKQYYHIMGGGEDMEVMFADYPKEGVSRGDAEEFCRRLSEKDGVAYRLPTEEEWEYVCRAGSTTAYYWGKKVRDDCVWHKGNSGMRTNRVGQKLPNAWGLYDMSGNVWEWCQGPRRGSLRGGAWGGGAAGLRSARRFYRLKGHNDFHGCGFRVVVDAN